MPQLVNLGVRDPFAIFGFFGSRNNVMRGKLSIDRSDASRNDIQRQAAALSSLAAQYAQGAQLQAVQSGQAVSGLVLRANQLATAAEPFFSTDTGSPLALRSVSTDSNAVTASVQSGASVQSLQVSVQQLATAQQNFGTSLSLTASAAATAGVNTFRLTVGSAVSNLQVTVNPGDTNSTLLAGMANAINQSGLSVAAEVQTDQLGNARLSITGTQTGEANSFSLQDTSGDAAAVTGANTVGITAQDSRAAINGITYGSSSNVLALDSGSLSLTLNSTTAAPETVSISVGANADAIANAAQVLTNAANQFRQYYSANASYLAGYANPTQVFKAIDLQTLGISQDSNHDLVVDRDKMVSSLSHDFTKAKDALVGLRGLAAELNSHAQLILNQPAEDLRAVSITDGGAYVASTAAQRFIANTMVGLFLNVRL